MHTGTAKRTFIRLFMDDDAILEEKFSDCYASALAVWKALNLLAFRHRSATFTQDINHVAHLAHVSYRTANPIILRMQEAGLLTYKRTGRESVFTLLRSAINAEQIGNGRPPSVADNKKEGKNGRGASLRARPAEAG